MVEENAPVPASVDERLISLAINRPSGAREVFRRLDDSSQIEGFSGQLILTAARHVFDKQSPAPMILSHDMIVGELQAMGAYDTIDQDVLNRCLNSKVEAKELASVIDIVKRRTRTGELNKAIAELSTAMDSDKRIEVVERIAELSREKTEGHEEKILTLDDWIAEVDTIDETPDCVSTGMPMLDRKLGGGWSKGGYHIISAPPGTGKTILMLTAWKNMLDQGIPSIYINYEIARGLFMKFMFAQFTGVNVQQPERYTFDEIKVAKEDFKAQIADLYDRKLLLITDPMAGSSKYWNDVDDMLREFSEDYGAQCVFFDTVNSVSARTRKGQDQRWNEYETIARESENLCQSLNLALILSAQQDTESVKRDDKTPKLGDVAGSKTLTEKAASVLHLVRTDIYDKKNGIDYSEIHITKNRAMGTEMGNEPVRVKYDPKFKRLYEVDPSAQTAERVVIEGDTEVFLTPQSVTGVKRHPNLQIDIEEGKDL